MKIRNKILLVTWTIILFSTGIFSIIAYQNQKRALLDGIDRNLYISAVMLRSSLSDGYHDDISKNSFTQDEYDKIIVDKNNRLCQELNLQYLWSCMVLNGDIVFTTSTSPSKDVAKKDHAGFFEVHRDPHAFDKVFSTMEPCYSSFHNEWGHGRMVLVPYADKKGRPYCFGASTSINAVYVILKKAAARYFLIFAVIFLIGLIISSILSNSFVKPILKLTRVADNIAKGNFLHKVDVAGSVEINSLAESIAIMRDAISKKITELDQDIVYRKKVEKELNGYRLHLEELVKERTKELQSAQAKLLRTEKLAALGKLAGMVGHELRNPLGVIRNSAYFLKLKLSKEVEDNKIKKHLDILEEEVERSDQIINDILSYGRIREPHKSRVKPNYIIKKITERLQIPSSITLDLKSGPGTTEIMADENQLTHLLTNIVLNAIDALHAGGRLSISTFVKDGNVEIKIKDTGIGIEEGALPKVFDPDFSTKSRGTGLGLAICQSIVNLHGGTINISSKVGEGTEVVVGLPINEKEE